MLTVKDLIEKYKDDYDFIIFEYRCFYEIEDGEYDDCYIGGCIWTAAEDERQGKMSLIPTDGDVYELDDEIDEVYHPYELGSISFEVLDAINKTYNTFGLKPICITIYERSDNTVA